MKSIPEVVLWLIEAIEYLLRRPDPPNIPNKPDKLGFGVYGRLPGAIHLHRHHVDNEEMTFRICQFPWK